MTDPVMPKAALEKLARRYGLGQYAGTVPAGNQHTIAPSIPTSFSVQEATDRFTFGPISYRGDLYQVSWGKTRLDNGATHTQDEWVAQLQGSEWMLAGGSLQFAMLHALYQEREGAQRDLVNTILEMVRPDYDARNGGNRTVTGTRILYTPSGDRVIHEYGSPQAYEIAAPVVGPDGWIDPGCGFDNTLETLVGTGDVPLLNEVTRWVHPVRPYLWRVNSTPSNEVQRALVLGVSVNVRFAIGADGSINNDRPARGVAAREKFP